jgi:hypothetical protein
MRAVFAALHVSTSPRIAPLGSCLASLDQGRRRRRHFDMTHVPRSAGLAADPLQEAHRLFHRLWSKAYDAPEYDKREWQRFEELLHQLGLRI